MTTPENPPNDAASAAPVPDTTEVQLEVIVNRGRTFEFLVAPRKPDAAKVAP